MKMLKKLIFLAIFLLVPLKVFAVSTNDDLFYNGYALSSYDINIVVNENNTLDITENIEAYFNTYKHGIFRKIPLKNNITRLDGTTSKNRVQISNIEVSDPYSLSKEDGYEVIKIGDADKTLIGKKNYTIKYSYNLGKDPSKDYDEFYFNLIGDEWDTSISNITFTITMPKEFDATKLGFSSGEKGSTDSSKVSYNVNGNKIMGKLNDVLNPEEALTIRLELPEGYFIGAGIPISLDQYLMIFVPIIFLVISLFIWYKFGRDEQVIETVEFYPPDGFNSLEVGFLYKGKAEDKDVTSLLIYLANKGYIKISETEEKSLFSEFQDFKITKLKEYDGNNINEKVFLNGLFPPSFTEVTQVNLYNRFYKTNREILHNINNKENKNKIFENKTSSKSIFIILMIILTYCLITVLPMITYGGSGIVPILFMVLLSQFVGFGVMYQMLFGETKTIYVNGIATHSSNATKLFGLFWGGIFGLFPWLIMFLPFLLEDSLYLISYILGFGCVLGMFICLKYLPKRTQYGNEILGKLKGFKNFLETAEKEKLESMVMQDPTYFYDILPFTYVLGVSDKWINKFESISLQSPDWYDGLNDFDMNSFGSFINTTMSSAQNSMSSSPSSDSDGSGGGSSDGGSGGGGGGSW